MAGDERYSWGLCFVSNLSKLINFILNECCSEQINFSWDWCLSVWTKITSGLHSVNIHLSPWVEMYAGERINNRCCYKTHDREAAARWKMMCAANLRDRLQLFWLELRMWFLIFFMIKEVIENVYSGWVPAALCVIFTRNLNVQEGWWESKDCKCVFG